MKKFSVLCSVFFLAIAFSIPVRSAPQQNGKVFVLVYHTFLDKKKLATDVSVPDLQSQITSLKQKGFTFVSSEDMLAGRIIGSKNILVTIDDGERSLLAAYADVLKPNGIKPLLAIYPNIIGKKQNALTWNELRALSADGCTIAAHGFYHQLVNQKLYDKDKNTFMGEIYKSKKVLEEQIGKPVTIFVYPFGVRSEITKKTLREAGYRCAFNLVWRPVLIPLERNSDLMELNRYMLSGGNAKAIFNSISQSSQEKSQ
jgi:peptidoglycan/xylan/chitin deacetylase (PgdA/CDA1 family)